jgi:hypothetical protein
MLRAPVTEARQTAGGRRVRGAQVQKSRFKGLRKRHINRLSCYIKKSRRPRVGIQEKFHMFSHNQNLHKEHRSAGPHKRSFKGLAYA